LTAFARFRLALAYALSDDRANANQTLQTAIATDGKYSGWATAFSGAFQASKTPTSSAAAKEGCVAAVKFSQQNPVLIEGLNQFGYANPTFKPEDICPILK
jgi:Tfp pilus assembly protein PilF